MIGTREKPRFEREQAVKIINGGIGRIIDVIPNCVYDHAYVLITNGKTITLFEHELAPLPNREKKRTKYELDWRNDSCCFYTEVECTIVEEIIALWKKDGLKLCSSKDRHAMKLIADYLHEYEVITLPERDALYQYLGIE